MQRSSTNRLFLQANGLSASPYTVLVVGRGALQRVMRLLEAHPKALEAYLQGSLQIVDCDSVGSVIIEY